MPLPDLPEPEHFTLEQICKRWSCDEDQLLQYCESNMLEIGVILNDTYAYQVGNKLDFDTDELERIYSTLDGFYALSTGDVRGTLFWGENPSPDEFNCRVTKVYLPKEDKTSSFNSSDENGFFEPEFNLQKRHIFSSLELVVSRTERNRFETEHSMNIDESINNDDLNITNPSKMGVQEKRELILKGWLAGKGLNIEQQLELTREEVWSAISQVDKSLFRTDGKESIKAFFTKAKLCSFKPGKRKG